VRKYPATRVSLTIAYPEGALVHRYFSALVSLAVLSYAEAYLRTLGDWSSIVLRRSWDGRRPLLAAKRAPAPAAGDVALCEGLRTPAHGMRGAVIMGRHPKTLTKADMVFGRRG